MALYDVKTGKRMAKIGDELDAVLAAEEGATLVDLRSNITLDMLMPDGLHITEAGNAKIAEVASAPCTGKLCGVQIPNR